MISQEQQETLADIFENSERRDKMFITLDPISKDITVTYRHLSSQWFAELRDGAELNQANEY